MTEIVSVDRIENGLAVLERADRTTLAIPLEQLPPGTKPGDCLTKTPEGFVPNTEETARRRQRNIDLFKKLKSRKTGGNR